MESHRDGTRSGNAVKCRVCHGPIIEGGEPRYSMADDYDTDTGEHYDCHFPNGRGVSIEEFLADADKMKAKLVKALSDLSDIERKSDHGSQLSTRSRRNGV